MRDLKTVVKRAVRQGKPTPQQLAKLIGRTICIEDRKPSCEGHSDRTTTTIGEIQESFSDTGEFSGLRIRFSPPRTIGWVEYKEGKMLRPLNYGGSRREVKVWVI